MGSYYEPVYQPIPGYDPYCPQPPIPTPIYPYAAVPGRGYSSGFGIGLVVVVVILLFLLGGAYYYPPTTAN